MSANSAEVRNLYVADATAFVEDWHVRVTWIAFLTLWVFWGLVWCVRSFFVGAATTVAASTTEPDATAADPEVSTKKYALPSFKTNNSSFAARIERGFRQVTESLFCLLCLLAINTFARASTRAVMILAWFFLAFSVVWFLAELVIDNRYLRVAYTVTYYGLGLAIAGLAYKQGFY